MIIVKIKNLRELKFSEFVSINRLVLNIDQIQETGFRCIAKKTSVTVLDKNYVSDSFSNACCLMSNSFDTMFKHGVLPPGCTVPSSYTRIIYDAENFKFVNLSQIKRPGEPVDTDSFEELMYEDEK